MKCACRYSGSGYWPDGLSASLAASTGVDSADEVVKYLLAGADVVMTTSSLLRHGIGHMKELRDGLQTWLDVRNLESLASLRGRMSHLKVADPTAFDRANYIKMVHGDTRRPLRRIVLTQTVPGKFNATYFVVWDIKLQ